MANKNKAPKQAPAAPAAKTNPGTSVQNVVDFKSLMEGMSSESVRGLDPNHQVDLLHLAHDIYGKDPNAAERYKMKTETVEKINHVVAIGVAVAIAREVTFAKNEFACLMNKAEINTINEFCAEMGIHINTNLLPAPNEEGNIEVPSSAVQVSKETKEKIEEEEVASNKEVETDPTKIENEEQLIEAIKSILINRPSVYQKVSDAVNFYQAYLKVKASKAENKEEELKKVNGLSRTTLLKEMAKLVGACPLVLNGVGRYMYTTIAQSKSPIAAFCMFRNTTKNKKTGAYVLTDEEIADYVRALVEWTDTVKVAEAEERIKSLEKNLEALKKDEKKNATGIKDTQERIETAKNNIAHLNEVLSYVLSPKAETLEELIKGYDEKDTVAVRTFNAISDSYYDEYNVKEMKQDGVRHNLKQYAGIITNLFRDPSARIDGYSESNLMQLEPIEAPAEKHQEEEKPEDSKKE